MSRLLPILFILIILPAASFAQELLTLEQAIAKTLEHNYDIRISDVTAQQAQTNNTWGNAGLLPSLNGVAGANASSNNADLEFVDGTRITRNNALNYGYSGSLGISWTVFAAGRVYLVKKQLNALQQISEVQLKAQVQASISQVIQAYSQVVYNQQQMVAIDTAIELARARMDLSKAKFDIGTSPKVDYLQGRVDFNASRSLHFSQVAGLETARANLNAIMGEDETRTYSVADSLVLNLALQPVDKERLRDLNLTLDAARRTAELSKIETRIARTALFPTLGVNGGYAYSYVRSQAGQFVFNRSYGPTGSASLNIPIFQGGNLRRQVKIASLQAMSDQLVYERQSTQLGSQYRSAWKSYETAVSTYELEEESIGYARENLDIQKARFKVGIATTLELREAENSYVQALARKYVAAYNVKVNETRVLELENKLAQ
jgi:outer membrane protein